MSLKVLTASVSKAKSLINSGKVDLNSSWGFSGADGNKLLGPDGEDWATYKQWFLAEDTSAADETKARFKYPYGKNGKVYRRGVIAAKSRAAQQGEQAVSDAADELLQLIDKNNDGLIECPECGAMIESGAVECDDCGYKMKDSKKVKTKDHSDSVQRMDILPEQLWMNTKFERTTEGFLKGRAVVTNAGVFTYKDADGSTHTELRLPEDVFDSASLDTLKLKPLTNDHPTEMVTPDTANKYQVGSLGSNPSSTNQMRDWNGNPTPYDKLSDGIHLAIDLIVVDADAINAVLNGKQALSCGYSCRLEKADAGAMWAGMPYDYIQRDIRYNHVALVDKARAGDAARIRLDSADSLHGAFSVYKEKGTQEDSMALKKLTLDGVEREAEDAVIVHLNQQKTKLDEALGANAALKTDMSKLEADRDTQKARADKAEADLKAAQEASLDQAKIDAAVDAKLALREAASKAGIEIKADSTDADLTAQVITKAFPDIKLDGKDAVYIQAMFEAAQNVLARTSNADSMSRLVAGGPIPGLRPGQAVNSKETQDQYDSQAARQRYIARLNSANEQKEA